MNERQLRYLDALREHGSAPRARQAAGVVRKTVSLWERDEAFAEAAAEAAEFALDTVVQASRAAALAGDSAQQTNWLKLARPELRHQSSIAVGVQVNADDRRRARIAELSDEELLDRARRITRDVELRALGLRRPAGDVIDVEVLPTSRRQLSWPVDDNYLGRSVT